ncbi:ATP-binding protein [uncultured Sanguibacteroides sp.]|uniref:ATP-binding protein n=1 Tax=uncultured Sanguibacteroides sp. TaxID=1635151 RepID=UPI0025D1876D|nr:ATP-binding protein [uncultured Sanguibacteroides sp.]
MNKRIEITWTISIIAMVCIVVFQVFWLYNLFQFQRSEYERSVNKILKEAVEQGVDLFVNDQMLSSRLSAISVSQNRKELWIVLDGEKDTINYDGDYNYVTLINRCCYDIVSVNSGKNIRRLDSICAENLRAKGINEKYILELIDLNRGVVLETTENEHAHVNKYIESSILTLGLTSNHGLIAYFDIPYRYFFVQMGGILIASILVMLILTWCFIYQIRTILMQKQLSEMREDFVYSMVHEIKGPLAFVLNALKMFHMRSVDGLSDNQKKLLDGIGMKVKSLSNLSEKMLVSGKNGKSLMLIPEELNLKAELEQIVYEYSMDHRSPDIHLDYACEEEMIRADRVHFPNVIRNLVDNAIKYSSDKPDITIRCRLVNGTFEVSVADKGRGIPKEYLNKIFESFYRIPNPKGNEIHGFGVGLSYVKQVIKSHGGKVLVESEVGKGSRFTIVMPDIKK